MSLTTLLKTIDDALTGDANAHIDSLRNQPDYISADTLAAAENWLKTGTDNTVAIQYNTVVRGLEEALRRGNEPAFRAVLSLLVAKFFSLSELDFLTSAGFHYTSEALGEWFRIKAKFNRNKYEISPAAERLYTTLYDILPRQDNLILAERLSTSFKITFGDSTSHSDGLLIVGTDLRQVLTQVCNDDGWYDFLRTGSTSYLRTDTGEDIESSGVTDLEELFEELWPDRFEETDETDPDKAAQKQKQKRARHIQVLVGSLFYHLHILDGDGSPGPEKYEIQVLPALLEGNTPVSDRDTDEEHHALPTANATLIYPKNTIFPSGVPLDDINSALRYLTARLAACEVAGHRRSDRRDLVEVENVIRQCTVLKGYVRKRVNRAQFRLESLMEVHRDDDTGEYPSRSVAKIMEEVCAASDRYLDILAELRHFAELNETDKLKPGKTIFFYSEPGCGKEMLAQLVHLLSCRSHDRTKSNLLSSHVAKCASQLETYANSFSDLEDKFSLKGAIEETRKKKSAFPAVVTKDWNRAASYFKESGRVRKSEAWICHRAANYVVLNCGLLDHQNFEEVMFGKHKTGGESTAGVLLKAHLLGGTVFLDEFNTMHPPLANKLLRVLESPFQMLVPGETRAITANIQIVVASNRKPEELVQDGFNSAVISRITKHYLEIPPLRERKEDIAIVVHKWIMKEKRDAEKEDPDGEIGKLESINLDAMRLICEQPWLRNYRGLRGFVDALLRQRKEQKLRTPELGFDEVLQCLRRQKAFEEGDRPSSRVRLRLETA